MATCDWKDLIVVDHDTWKHWIIANYVSGRRVEDRKIWRCNSETWLHGLLL